LYPAMPYPSYVRITPQDMRALYAYFLHGVQPVAQANKPENISWPLDMRWPLAIWNWLFARDGVYRPDPKQTAQWNRGAYLVEGLGHCGACHTPRGLFLQEKALAPGGPNGSLYLSGARIDNWYAANLRGDLQDGLGRWTPAELVQLLKTGRTSTFSIVGSMTEVVHDSTQHLNDGDLRAIAVFLKSLPPIRPHSAINQPVKPVLTAAARAGAPLYAAHCAMCHQAQGQGIPNVFPALALNPTVNTPDPLNTIRMMLRGGHTVQTQGNPTPVAMPDLGATLNDTQVAEIASYVRSSWGNDAPNVRPAEVARIRRAIASH
ncbi:MAG: c-type cytochrome, partial [Thiomonas sp.]